MKISEIIETIRAEVLNRHRLTSESESTSNPGRIILPPISYLTPMPLSQLLCPIDTKETRVKDILHRARGKITVNRRIPKVLRRLFRKQGGYNELLLESVSIVLGAVVKLNEQLAHAERVFQAQTDWLVGMRNARENDTSWMAAVEKSIERLPHYRKQLSHLANGIEAFSTKHTSDHAESASRLAKIGEHLQNLQIQADSTQTHLKNIDSQARGILVELEKLQLRTHGGPEKLEEFHRLILRLEEQIVTEEAFLKAELHLLNRRWSDMRSPSLAGVGDSVKTSAPVSEENELDAFYVAFEERFRGPRSLIKERLKSYLPEITSAAAGQRDSPILDLGCGRGEWLELLKERAMLAEGIDSNIFMIGQCRQRSLEVTEGEVVEVLQGKKEASFGAVTAFHLIEHLPPPSLLKLMREVLRVLKPNGLAIFETPNPDNILVASNRFYLDPTHLRPLPKELVEFSMKRAGFREVRIRTLQPASETDFGPECPKLQRFVKKAFFGDQDYSVIARK